MVHSLLRRATLLAASLLAISLSGQARAAVDPRTLEKPAATQFNLKPGGQVAVRQMMDLDYAQIQEDDLLANEMGEAPVLEHGGTRLTQSGVILTYLAERAGLRQVQVSDYEIEAEFWSLDDLAAAYSTSMALGDPESAGALQQELAVTMAPFMKGDQVVFTMAGLMLEARP